MRQLIKRLLNIDKLEQDQRKLEKDLASLADLVKTLSKRKTHLSQELEKLQSSNREISVRMDHLENRLRAIGEDLETKAGVEKFDRIEGEVDQITDLLQQVKRDNYENNTGPSIGKENPKGSTIQEVINNLPNSLKRVVKVLFNSETPLTYQELAERMDKKEATARSYIYRLTEKGFPLESIEKEGERKKVKLPLKVKRQLTVPEPTGNQ